MRVETQTFRDLALIASVLPFHPDVGLLGAYVVAELAARIKTTRKTIESGIPEHRLVELSFWIK